MPISCMLNNDYATCQQSKASNSVAITWIVKGSLKTVSACPAPGTPTSEEVKHCAMSSIMLLTNGQSWYLQHCKEGSA